MADRRNRRGWADSLRPLLPLAGAWLVATGVLALLAAQHRIPYEALFLDPSYFSGLPWYTGLVSDLGVVGWVAAATLAALGARVAGLDGRAAARRYLGGAALFTTLMALDDLFELHGVVTDVLSQPKAAFYGLYLVLGLWWLADNWAEARRTRWPLLAAAVAALATSVVIDQVVAPSPAELLAEDSPKFLGIVAWALYFGLTADDVARSVVRSRPPGAAAQPGNRAEPADQGRTAHADEGEWVGRPLRRGEPTRTVG